MKGEGRLPGRPTTNHASDANTTLASGLVARVSRALDALLDGEIEIACEILEDLMTDCDGAR